MFRRILAGIVILALAFMPLVSSEVSAQFDGSEVSIAFYCFNDGSARLEATNSSPGSSLSVNVFARISSSSYTEAGSMVLDPGEREILAISPIASQVGGWEIGNCSRKP